MIDLPPLQFHSSQKSSSDTKSKVSVQIISNPDYQPGKFDLESERAAKFIEYLTNEISLRKKSVNYVAWLLIGWVASIVLILLFDGFKLWGFDLSDQIILSLIGATTANIIGMFIIILKSIFPKRKDGDNIVNDFAIPIKQPETLVKNTESEIKTISKK